VIDGVAAAAAYSDYLYYRFLGLRVDELNHMALLVNVTVISIRTP
jgi:hypothetical protein